MPGAEVVFAAGDVASYPNKQGGLAAQMADTAARGIAIRAGADVKPWAFRPILRAKLLSGAGPTYLRERVGSAFSDSSQASAEPLWWPAGKVAAPYLGRYLDRLEQEDAAR